MLPESTVGLQLKDFAAPQLPVFQEDNLFVAPPEYTLTLLDLSAGTILTQEQVRDRITNNVIILMDAGIYSGINTTEFENDHTAGNNLKGITYIPEAYLNMRALAAMYRLHGHVVSITPSQPGSLDGIYSTDPEKTFLSLEKLDDGNYKVLGVTTILSRFTHGSRYLEIDWRSRLVNQAKTIGGEKSRKIVGLQHFMEFGDTRVFAQGTEAHSNPFVLAGIADTTVRIGKHESVNPETKYNITAINGEKVFVINVEGNISTVLESSNTGTEKFIDVTGQNLILNDGTVLNNFAGSLSPATVGRSSWKGHQEFLSLLQENVNPAMELHTILLRQPFYHMDTTGFRAGKHFFTNHAAFTEESFAKLQQLIGVGNVVELPLDDIGKAFGGNATSLGSNVYISDQISSKAINIITSHGHNVHLSDISYTMKSGGGQRCMTAQQYVSAPGLKLPEIEKNEFGQPLTGKVFKAIINYETGDTYYGQVKKGAKYDKGTDIGLDELIFPPNTPEHFRSKHNGLIELHRVVAEHEAKFQEAMARKSKSVVPQNLVPFDKRTDYLTSKRSTTIDLSEFVKDWIELGHIMETFLDAAQSIVLLGQETYKEHGNSKPFPIPRVEMSDIPVNGETPQWVIDLIGDWRTSMNVHKVDGPSIQGHYPAEPSSVKKLVGVADISDAFHIPLRNTLGGAFRGIVMAINWPEDIRKLNSEFNRLRKDYADSIKKAIETADNNPSAKKSMMAAAIMNWEAQNNEQLGHTLQQLRFRLMDPHATLSATIGKGEAIKRVTINNTKPVNPNIPDSYPHLAILGIAGTAHGAFDSAKVPKLAYYFLSNAAGGESNLVRSAIGVYNAMAETEMEIKVNTKSIEDMQKAVDLRYRTLHIMRKMLEISGTTYSQAIDDLERLESFTKQERQPTFPIQNKEEAALLLYAVSSGIRQFEIAAQRRKPGQVECRHRIIGRLEKAAEIMATGNGNSFTLPELLSQAERYIKDNMSAAKHVDNSHPFDKAGKMLSRENAFQQSLEVLNNVRDVMITNQLANNLWSGAPAR